MVVTIIQQSVVLFAWPRLVRIAETVTYMLAGRMRHRDNHGHSGLLGPGSVQWMTAGRGIVHSEMPEQEDGLMWGFQLWVNLPAKDKMTAPRYQEFDPAAVPMVELASGARIRVVAGRVAGAEGPVRGIATEPALVDIALLAGGAFSLDLPRAHHAFVYPFEGDASIGDPAVKVPRGTFAVLGQGERVVLEAGAAPARMLLAAAKPLNEPVARYGPFVMNAAGNPPGGRRLSGGAVLRTLGGRRLGGVRRRGAQTVGIGIDARITGDTVRPRLGEAVDHRQGAVAILDRYRRRWRVGWYGRGVVRRPAALWCGEFGAILPRIASRQRKREGEEDESRGHAVVELQWRPIH